MADTRITINCEDHGEDCTIIKVTAERDYKPIFTEAFYSTEKPLGVYPYRTESYQWGNAWKTWCRASSVTAESLRSIFGIG